MCLRGCYLCTVLVVLSVQQTCVNAAPAAESNVSKNRLSGKFLLSLGTNNSSPLLRMLGRTFINYGNDVKDVERLVEKLCQLHPCKEWESWSRCPAINKGQFGMKTRSRGCSKNDSICASKESNDWPTEETMVCEGWCTEPYNDTNGFCLRFVTEKMTQHEAQAACEKNGGHIVNIDTRDKYDAVGGLLQHHGFISTIWINGNRTQPGADWHYTYGSVPDAASLSSTNLSNGSTELCQVQEDQARKWYDRSCSGMYNYVCEVV